MNQKGFIQLSILGWAAVAAGIVIVLLMLAVKVQTARLASCHKELAVLEVKVKAQNDAIDALKAESDRKQAAAAKALAKAESKAKVWDDQAKRLAEVLTNRKADGPKDCNSAWTEIRR